MLSLLVLACDNSVFRLSATTFHWISRALAADSKIPHTYNMMQNLFKVSLSALLIAKLGHVSQTSKKFCEKSNADDKDKRKNTG